MIDKAKRFRNADQAGLYVSADRIKECDEWLERAKGTKWEELARTSCEFWEKVKNTLK